MALTKQTHVDKIEIIETVTEDGTPITFVQIRQKIQIVEGSEVISESSTRYIYSAGDDYSSESTKVQNICNAAFS